jgi:hypothetical protein
VVGLSGEGKVRIDIQQLGDGEGLFLVSRCLHCFVDGAARAVTQP